MFFPGPNCEIDVSVCNATESKCSNGGECIDGFGPAYHCNCPSGKGKKPQFLAIFGHLGRNRVHLTERFGFVN